MTILIVLLSAGLIACVIGIHSSLAYPSSSSSSSTFPNDALLSGSQILFQNGFENGLTSWSQVSGSPAPVTVSSPVYAGSYALECSDPQNSMVTTTIPSESSVYAEAEFQLDQLLTWGSQTTQPQGEHLIAFYDQFDNPIGDIGLSCDNNNHLRLEIETFNPSQYSYYDISNLFQLKTWFSVGFGVTDSICTGYFNDVAVTSFYLSNSLPAVNSVAFGMFYASGDIAYPGHIFVDNAQIGLLNSSPNTTPSPSSPTPTATSSASSVTLTTNVSGLGTITPIPDTYSYGLGTSVSLTATAASGYEFDYWVVTTDGVPSAAEYQSSSLTLTLSASMTALAVFINPNGTPAPSPTPIPLPSPTPTGITPSSPINPINLPSLEMWGGALTAFIASVGIVAVNPQYFIKKN